MPKRLHGSVPGGINNNGAIVGESLYPFHGFWFDANGCQDLDPSFQTGLGVAYSVNDLAQIVGESYTDSGTTSAVVLGPQQP